MYGILAGLVFQSNYDMFHENVANSSNRNSKTAFKCTNIHELWLVLVLFPVYSYDAREFS